MFLSFSLDGWSDRAERWVKARFWRWLTASGRSDQSHRLAPVSITPYTCHHNQREGWEGKGKATHSRKGALTTVRPLLVNACLTGETCAKHFADICYTASGLRAETQLHPTKRNIKAEWTSGSTECATHIFQSKNSNSRPLKICSSPSP